MKKIIKELIPYIVIIIVVVLVRTYIITPVIVVGDSMVPTLKENQILLLNKIDYQFNEIERYDIVVIKVGKSEIIKRVIGLPGEKIEIKRTSEGKSFVYINGKRLEENYIMSEYDYHKCNENMYCGPFVIPEGEYFMMGDNRGNSQDSRFWGTLPEERFIGRAVFTFWPLNHLNVLK